MAEIETTKIRLDQVTFGYGEEKILRNINLKIGEGDFVCILGSSGCGKSTLLSLLEGLQFPDEGEITVDGKKITGPGLDRSVVFQDYSLFPWMSTGKNILIALKQRDPKKPERELRKKVQSYFKMVGLDGVFDKLPGELSGGMRQRAAIARAFSTEAPILLMDEPFGALDAITRSTLQDLLVDLWIQKKQTVVFVTHDVDEALFLATRVIVLGNGGIQLDVPIKVKERYKELFFQDERVQKLKERILRMLNHVEEEKYWDYVI